MLKLLQYCNYIIIVMQIKPMLLLLPQINLIFAHFFSFPENIKTPFELSLIQFTRFSDKSNVLKFIIFRRYPFLPPLK